MVEGRLLETPTTCASELTILIVVRDGLAFQLFTVVCDRAPESARLDARHVVSTFSLDAPIAYAGPHSIALNRDPEGLSLSNRWPPEEATSVVGAVKKLGSPVARW